MKSYQYGHKDLCAVTATKTWIEKASLNQGPLFHRFSPHGALIYMPISSSHLNRIIMRLALSSNLKEANHSSSHSLRRGFATEASRRGAPFVSIKKQGRWRHDGTVLGYIEEGKRFEENAVTFILKA